MLQNLSTRTRTAFTQALAFALLLAPFAPWVDSPLTGRVRGYSLPRALRVVDQLSAALNGDSAPRINPFLLVYLLPFFAGAVFLLAFLRRETATAVGLAGTVPIAALAYAHALLGAELPSMLTPTAWATLALSLVAVLTGCGATLRPASLRSEAKPRRFTDANLITLVVFLLAVGACVFLGRMNRPR